MKKLLCAIALAAVCIGGPRLAFAENISLANDVFVAQDTNYDFPFAGDYSSLTFALTYSTTPPASFTFTDGRKSTATITVSKFNDLIPRAATMTISVMSASTTTLRNTGVTLNGERFYAGPGGEWTPVTTATGNAVALAAAINASSNFDAAAVSTVVYATCTVAGSYANAWAVATNSTTSFRLNGAGTSPIAFLNGSDRARLTINGVTYDIATATAVTSNAVTAKNISDTLMADSLFTAIAVSTWASNVVYTTAAAVGVNAYAITTSSPAALGVNGSASSQTGTFLNGSATTIDLTAETFTANIRPNTGYAVWLGTGGFTTPGGLANGTTYYLIRSNPGVYKLATTKANATAGTAIDITSQAGGGTFTMNPVVMPATTGFGLQWQTSNDNLNWSNYTTTDNNISISSITINSATAATTTLNNLGNVGYRYLRLKYSAPAQGGTNITATGNGRR